MSDDPALAHPAPVHPVSAPADIAPADTHSVFAELVCADPGLLQAEFEAIIAANFPPGDGRRSRHPPRRPGPTRTDRARPVPQVLSSSRSGPRAGSGGGSGTDRAARERGPPRQHARPEQRTRAERKTSEKEVIDRPMSSLSESDGPTLVTTMIDRPGCPILPPRQTHPGARTVHQHR